MKRILPFCILLSSGSANAAPEAATQPAPPIEIRQLEVDDSSIPRTQVEQVRPPLPPPPAIYIPPPVAPPPPPPAPSGTPARPVGNPGMWIGVDDYPDVSQFDQTSGTTAFRLSINAQGRVSACDITATSGDPALDEATCRLIARRARFTPAADYSGTPMPGSYSSRVRWRWELGYNGELAVFVDPRVGRRNRELLYAIKEPRFLRRIGEVYPETPITGADQVNTIVRLTLDVGGQLGDCRIEIPSGYPEYDAAACTAFENFTPVQPSRDDAGRIVADEVRIRISW